MHRLQLEQITQDHWIAATVGFVFGVSTGLLLAFALFLSLITGAHL